VLVYQSHAASGLLGAGNALMQLKGPKLIVAAHRVAAVRRIIASQDALIEKLRASKQDTLDAERSLRTYISSLTHLEDHERRLKECKPHTETLANRDHRQRKLLGEEDFSADQSSLSK
jgi:hypothetical protein